MVSGVTRGRGVDWRHDVRDEALYWCVFAVLTPLFVWLCRRFPLGDGTRRRAVLAHFAAAPAVAALQVLLYIGVLQLTAIALGQTVSVSQLFGANGSLFLPLAITAYWKYWVIVGLIHGVAYARLYAYKQQEAAELRAQLSAAQLDRLKAQLQPHFLFNTLNSIAVLLHDEPQRAHAMLLRLSDMLRAVVTSTNEQFVPLSRELTFIQQYLDIQQMRFGDRLQVEMDVAPDLQGELVPHFLIQPIVENAVHHGISSAERGGTVAVRAARHDGGLRIEVTDMPFEGSERRVALAGTGVGLSNTRERLAQLYGGDACLTITTVDASGTRVEVSIPARPARVGTGNGR
jgi:two-component system, LytTR family, sensor kinase